MGGRSALEEENMESKVRSIVVAMDDSSPALAALERAIQRARFHSADLHLVHVVDRSMTFTVPHAPTAPILDLGDPAEIAMERLQIHAEFARTRGVQAKAHLLRGAPAEEITKLAKQLHASEIVIGTRGRTGLERLVLGSVSERVSSRADGPVVIVPGHPIPSPSR